MIYAGPRRRVSLAAALDLIARGWVAEQKMDGCYLEVHVGSCWRAPAPRGGPALRADRGLDHRWSHNQRVHSAIVGGRYRSGRSAVSSMGMLIGLELDSVPEGSVLCGELMTSTPESARWLANRGAPDGLVLFDCLKWGAEDLGHEPQARRRARLECATRRLDGMAARMVTVVEQRRTGVAGWYRELVAEGHEGLVLKDPGAPVGRGAAKLKRTDTVDVRVIAIFPDENIARVDWGGVSFNLTLPKWPVRVGQIIEVKASGFYDSGIPRHASALRWRDDLAGPVTWKSLLNGVVIESNMGTEDGAHV